LIIISMNDQAIASRKRELRGGECRQPGNLLSRPRIPETYSILSVSRHPAAVRREEDLAGILLFSREQLARQAGARAAEEGSPTLGSAPGGLSKRCAEISARCAGHRGSGMARDSGDEGAAQQRKDE
jgi:hypothetical protein